MSPKSKLIKLPVIAGVLFCQTAIANTKETLCDSTLIFENKPQAGSQKFNVAENIKLELTRMLDSTVLNGATIASNATCQKLNGAAYTGSADEWSKFFSSTTSGLSKNGFKNITLTMLGDDKRSFRSDLPAYEYIIKGTKGRNTQVLHNLAVLDKARNTLYTLSVSGNEEVDHMVAGEFVRLVATFDLKNEN